MKSIKNNKGFTLTEIVVVIAIIGVLAVALVPKLNSFLGKADRVGAITDFQSSFANVVRAEVIEKGKLPAASRLKSELEYQFTYHDGSVAETAVASNATLSTIFKPLAETDFTNNKVTTTLTATDFKYYRVAYLKDDSTKRYMVLCKYSEDVSGATIDLDTVKLNAITFIALNTSDKHSVVFKMKPDAKTRDMVSNTDSFTAVEKYVIAAPANPTT